MNIVHVQLPLPPPEVASLVMSLAPFFHKRRLLSGQVLLQAGQNVEELVLIEQVRAQGPLA